MADDEQGDEFDPDAPPPSDLPPFNLNWQGEPGEEPPPWVQSLLSQAAHQQDRMQMGAVDRVHNEHRFYREAPLDFLRAHLTILMSCMAGPGQSAPGITFHVGFVQAYIAQRFNICPYCGVDHDEELHKALGDESPSE